ncbi:MAG: DUF4199 domain-containing protein, partial [Bacteroidota bacterium]
MQQVLKYGILAGIAVAVYSTSEYLIGLHGPYLNIGQYVGYLRYVLVAGGIYLAVKQTKDVQSGAPLTFWRAVGVGTGVAAISGVVISLYEIAYLEFINPNFLQDYSNFLLDNMRAQGATAEQIEQMTEQIKTYSSTGAQFLFYFGETTVVGFLFSLIAGTLLRT